MALASRRCRVAAVIPTTIRVSALAEIIKQRGWEQIDVGQHMQGDIGVKLDDEGHAGKDHIHLVIKKINQDKVIVSDNKASTPHVRDTQTGALADYFLRAI